MNQVRKKRVKVQKDGKSINKLLLKAYETGPAAYSNADRLHLHTKATKQEISNFLNTTNSYTKYKNVRRKFQRLKVMAFDINEIWAMDLAYVDKLAKYNKNVKYLLVAVDVLSRYVRVQPLENKFAKTTLHAFKQMLKKGKRPQKVWTDKGTEFKGVFAEFCTKENISMYSTESETKASLAERAIRSLKTIIYKYLEQKWTWSYLPKLQDFVKTMNTRINRTIKMAPSKVTKSDVPYLMSLFTVNKRNKPTFKVGDTVRIAKKDIPFKKGYQQSFTDETFRITDIPTRNPPTYTIIDTAGEKIHGKFYRSEMVKIS